MADTNPRKRKHAQSFKDKAPVGIKEDLKASVEAIERPSGIDNTELYYGPWHPTNDGQGTTIDEIDHATFRFYNPIQGQELNEFVKSRFPLRKNTFHVQDYIDEEDFTYFEPGEDDEIDEADKELYLDQAQSEMERKYAPILSRKEKNIEKDIHLKRLQLLHKIFPQLPTELRMEINDRVLPPRSDARQQNLKYANDDIPRRIKRIHRYEGWKE